MTNLITLTINHGDELTESDFATLMVFKRTLNALMEHGFIESFDTWSRHTSTKYKFTSNDPYQHAAALMDLFNIAPDWSLHLTIDSLP